jgi:hypothetical protein
MVSAYKEAYTGIKCQSYDKNFFKFGQFSIVIMSFEVVNQWYI